jgi:hypothetical protein
MEMRPELDPLPERMRRLPLDHRGYVVPWFVPWVNGIAEFRAMDPEKFVQAVKQRLCWVCGEPLGRFKTFTLGPMCTITRTSSEPPSHHECATYSARNCPFLTRPRMVRREDAFTESLKENGAGIMLDRNPGVTALWTTHRYTVFPDPQQRPLIEVGDPTKVEWYVEKRAATRAEVEASIDGGYPVLAQLCDLESTEAQQAEARLLLAQKRGVAERYLPHE